MRKKFPNLNIKKDSLRLKLTVCLIFMMMMAILFCWISSRTMLEHYFVQTERKNITRIYKAIDAEIEKKGSIQTLYLEKLATKNNLKIIIAKSDKDLTGLHLQMVYCSTSETGKMYMKMYDLLREVQGKHMLGMPSKQEKEIQGQGYTIRERLDSNLDSTSITLIGLLGEDYYIAIDSSIESLQTAANIATRFLAYAGIIITAIASILLFWYGKRFTKPIEEMSKIAVRMADLDFEAKVTHLPKDEIGQLGTCMNQLSDQLEQSISELKSANKALQKDIDHKIQIDEMRKEFLSHVSHELKTPIALIQGYAEGLVDNVNEDPESREFYCDVIMDEAKKMNELVQKLMALNELEFGTTQLEVKCFNITELLHNLIESYQIKVQQKKVSLECMQEAPVFVWGDEFMIEDVLNNYISNAFHHVYEGGKIRIWMERKDSQIRVWVYNDGDLIPEEDLDKIWVKFYKVDKARTREYGGSGVGLSIVSAIMEAHGNDYGVLNKEHGVAFYFELEEKR